MLPPPLAPAPPNLDDASQEPIAVAVRRIAAKPVARKWLARRSLTYPMPGNGSAQRLRWDIRHVTVLAAMLLGVPEATQLRHHHFTQPAVCGVVAPRLMPDHVNRHRR